MKKTTIATSVLVLLSILLSSCNLQAASPTQMGPDQINTIAAATVQALTTQMAPPPATATPLATEVPTATATLAVPTLNLTGIPTLSLATSTLIPLPTTAGSTGCNQIGTVEDVTIKDNDVIKANQWFVKTWKLTNNGTCTWTTSYNANFVSGDAIQGDVSSHLLQSVPPGGTATISINLKAPAANGTYQSYWNLTDADGKPFGIGSGGGNYWILFKVGATSGSSTNITIGTAMTSGDVSSAAGTTIPVSGNITLSGITTDSVQVRYFFKVKDTQCTDDGNWTFSLDGTKAVTGSCVIPGGLASGTYKLTLYIGDPHGANSATQATLTIP